MAKSPFPEFDFKWPNFDQGFLDRFTVPGLDTRTKRPPRATKT